MWLILAFNFVTWSKMIEAISAYPCGSAASSKIPIWGSRDRETVLNCFNTQQTWEGIYSHGSYQRGRSDGPCGKRPKAALSISAGAEAISCPGVGSPTGDGTFDFQAGHWCADKFTSSCVAELYLHFILSDLTSAHYKVISWETKQGIHKMEDTGEGRLLELIELLLVNFTLMAKTAVTQKCLLTFPLQCPNKVQAKIKLTFLFNFVTIHSSTP